MTTTLGLLEGANRRKLMKVKFTVPGKPMGKQRPRVVKNGAYTPEKTVSYENLVKLIYNQLPGPKMFEGEVTTIIDAYFEIPKKTSNKRRNMMLFDMIRPTKKPDCDNITKIILDSLNTIAYKDDSQVVTAIVNKYYSCNPRVEVTLQDAKGE